jgi:hypothetical protein
MMAFKTYGGEFASRRLIKLKQEFEKEEVINNDDVSMAAVYFGD